MRIREHLTRTLLTSAVIAGPAILGQSLFTMAEDTQISLKPAGPAATLRQVPDAPEPVAELQFVQQIGYRDDENPQTSTVNAELEQVFQKNGQTMPSLKVANLPNVRLPKIRLVQHAGGKKQNAQQADASQEKKPGLLRRWFGKLTSDGETSANEAGDNAAATRGSSGAQGASVNDKDNPYQNSGEPVRRLPTPPPITYQSQNQSAQTRATSHPSNAVQPLIQNAAGKPAAGSDKRSTDRVQRPIQRNDGFINPFVDAQQTRQEEVYLDLDSLIQGTDKASENRTDQSVQPASQDEEALPELVVKPARTAEPVVVQDANNPFTGYHLNVDQTETKSSVTAATQPTSDTTSDNLDGGAETSIAEVKDTLNQRVPLLEDVTISNSAASEFAAPASDKPVTKRPTEVNPFEEIPLLKVKEESQPEDTAGEAFENEPPPEMNQAGETPESADTKTVRQINAPAIPKSSSIRAVDSRVRQEQQRYRIMARTGVAGFKGFCPVTLRDQRDLIDSREEFRAKFGLQTYYFATAEARSIFEANPARYAPAAGGSDVVLLVNTAEDAAGTLDFSLWYRDRLYMFRSRETQAIFSKNPTRYADQY